MAVRFGRCIVDLDRVEIHRDGQLVAVQPQVFTVIEYLIAHRDRVVTKEELLDNIWGDRFVGESTLTSRIKSARRALGDSGAAQTIIRTVQGRGYRFVADIESEPDEQLAPQTGPPSIEHAEPSIVRTTTPRPVTTIPPSGDASISSADHHGGDDWPLVGRYAQLETVERLFDGAHARGVHLVGPPGNEALRFGRACRRYAERHGTPNAHVRGLASARDIPLAVMSHLLSPDVLNTDHSVDDLARADVMRRAVAEVRDALDGKRMLLQVERPDLLDPMSATVLRTLISEGAVFVLVIGGGTDGGAQLGVDVAADDLIEEVRLPALSEVDVDILLHRVLDGPIDPATLRQLIDASAAMPEFLRNIVEASRQSAALRLDNGVWRLVAPPVSTTVRSWERASLSPAAVHATEVLAIAGSLPIGRAESMFGIDALEELDRRRVMTLTDDRISLADPLLALEVEQSIGSLRQRRLRNELIAEMLDDRPDPALLVRMLTWSEDLDRPVDAAVVMRAAQEAMIAGDLHSAGELVELGRDLDAASAGLIAGEVALSRGQWSRAESIFDSIDVDGLDETSTAQVLRRRAAITFYAHARYDEALDTLAAEAASRGGRVARALAARRVGMLAFLGRVDELEREAEELGDLHGLTRIEVLLAVGAGRLMTGQLSKVLGVQDEVEDLIRSVPAAWASEPRDAVLIQRCLALLELGEVDVAADLARSHLPVGRRTLFGYLPSVAAEIELVAGRARAAREHVRFASKSSHREVFPQFARIAAALFARTELALGHHSGARRGLADAERALALSQGELHWKLSIIVAELRVGLGEPVGVDLVALSDEAFGVGATMRAAELLFVAARLDRSGDVARSVLDRVESAAAAFDGRWWPIRVAELRARAEGAPLGPVAVAYRDLGLVGEAVRLHQIVSSAPSASRVPG